MTNEPAPLADDVRRKRWYPGHRIEKLDESWMCSCGTYLGREGRRLARDVMRFHRLDLWMAERKRTDG